MNVTNEFVKYSVLYIPVGGGFLEILKKKKRKEKDFLEAEKSCSLPPVEAAEEAGSQEGISNFEIVFLVVSMFTNEVCLREAV